MTSGTTHRPGLAGEGRASPLWRAAAVGVARILFLAASAVVLHGVFETGGGAPLLPWDKAEHFSAFFGLTLLALPAFPRAPVWTLALALILEGGLIELVQATPLVGRDADILDWAADAAGVAAVTAAAALPRLRRGLR